MFEDSHVLECFNILIVRSLHIHIYKYMDIYIYKNTYT